MSRVLYLTLLSALKRGEYSRLTIRTTPTRRTTYSSKSNEQQERISGVCSLWPFSFFSVFFSFFYFFQASLWDIIIQYQILQSCFGGRMEQSRSVLDSKSCLTKLVSIFEAFKYRDFLPQRHPTPEWSAYRCSLLLYGVLENRWRYCQVPAATSSKGQRTEIEETKSFKGGNNPTKVGKVG